VSIRGQKIRKNIKTNERIRKDKIMCFQTLSAQLLDIKQLTKTKGQESLLPSQPENLYFLGKISTFFDFVFCVLVP